MSPDRRGLLHQPRFLRDPARAELLAWLGGIRPLWEQRFSTRRPPPRGESQRPLLRPVYWLGNWQFACLGYYEPPRRRRDTAVAAEPFPPVLQALAAEMERRIRKAVPAAFIPAGWALDTCLINFYGDLRVGGRWEDRARVGDHRDHEPGPVASLSLGERALFQFVTRGRDREVVRTIGLEGDALLAFAGPWWKEGLLHRVQRVEDRGARLGPPIEAFQTRRINLTFRHVPPADVQPWAQLGPEARADVEEYVRQLAETSPFWRASLDPCGA